MINWQNIKHYIVGIFAILFFLFANQTIFANEYGQVLRNDIAKTGSSVENVILIGVEIGQNEIENWAGLKIEFRQECENVGKVFSIAAKTGTKVLSQFAESSLEDAVSFTMKQKGTHIFANNLQPKPWLNQLSTQMGWNENVIRATLQNANGRIVPTAQGIFNTPVNVGGLNFTIRGYFNQGSPIMNSIFIP